MACTLAKWLRAIDMALIMTVAIFYITCAVGMFVHLASMEDAEQAEASEQRERRGYRVGVNSGNSLSDNNQESNINTTMSPTPGPGQGNEFIKNAKTTIVLLTCVSMMQACVHVTLFMMLLLRRYRTASKYICLAPIPMILYLIPVGLYFGKVTTLVKETNWETLALYIGSWVAIFPWAMTAWWAKEESKYGTIFTSGPFMSSREQLGSYRSYH